jgi:hypothetical protein
MRSRICCSFGGWTSLLARIADLLDNVPMGDRTFGEVPRLRLWQDHAAGRRYDDLKQLYLLNIHRAFQGGL